MSDRRLAKMDRVLEFRQRLVDRCQVELAELERRARAASLGSAQAELAWSTAVHCMPQHYDSSVELGQALAFIATLRQRWDAAARLAVDADRRSKTARTQLNAAKTERKKIELWRDGAARLQDDEEARRERLATDDIAARITRAS